MIIGGEEYIIGVAKTATVTIGATTFDVVMTGHVDCHHQYRWRCGGPPNADWTALLRSIDYRHDGTLVSTTVGARTLALTAEDLAGNTQSSLTTIDVTTNNTPVDDDETAAPTEDTPFSVPAATGLLANATDVEGDPISISGSTIAGITAPNPSARRSRSHLSGTSPSTPTALTTLRRQPTSRAPCQRSPTA